MLRTALGPSIAAYLEDPSIVEVMLNPDGRLWIDRLSGELEDTGCRVTSATPSGSCAWSPTTSASKSTQVRPGFPPSCRTAGSDSRGWYRRWWQHPASPSAAQAASIRLIVT